MLQQWIPRELNACADDILNIIVFDDWYTSQGFFAHLDLIWGPYTVDRFADAFNADLFRFNSGFRLRVQKLLMPFQSHEQRRITGSFRQYIVLLG